MNVLLISREFPPTISGGQGHIVKNLAYDLASRGNKIQLVIPRQTNTLYLHENIKVHEVDMLGKTFLTRIPSFYINSIKTLKKLATETDVIYVHGSLIYKSDDAPTISHFHTFRIDQAHACFKAKRYIHALLNCLYIPIDWMIAYRSDEIITLPSMNERKLAPFIAKHTKTHKVANGIDFNLFKPKRIKNVRALKDCPNERKTTKIIHFGRLDVTKGTSLLIDSISHLEEHEISLTIVGRGPDISRLRKHAQMVPQHIEFLDSIENRELPDFLSNFDLAVFPSYFETFGLAVLECIALELPVISSTSVPCFGQKTFPTGDIHALAQMISEYRLKTQEFRSTAMALRDKTIGQYDKGVMCERIHSILSNACRVKNRTATD